MRDTLNINFELERTHLIKSTLRPTLFKTVNGSERLQMELQNRFDVLETECNIDEDFSRIVKAVWDIGSKFCWNRHTGRKSKFSDETLKFV